MLAPILILLQVLVASEIDACAASGASYARNQARVAVRGYLHLTRHGSYLTQNKEYSRDCGIVLLLSASDEAALEKHPEAAGVTFQTSSRAKALYDSHELHRFDVRREAREVIAHGRLIMKKAVQVPSGLKEGNGFGPQGSFRVALLVEDLEWPGAKE